MGAETTLFKTKNRELKIDDLPFFGYEELEQILYLRHDIDLFLEYREIANVEVFDFKEVTKEQAKQLIGKVSDEIDEVLKDFDFDNYMMLIERIP